MDDRRDPEPGLLDEIALDVISQLRDALRSGSRLDGDAPDLADAVRGGERQSVQGEIAVHEEAREPHAPELGALLLHRHARHQFIDVCHKAPLWPRRCSTMMSPDRSPCLLSGTRRRTFAMSWTTSKTRRALTRGRPPAGGGGIGRSTGRVVSSSPRAGSAGKPLASLHLGLPARASTWRPGAGCGQSDPSKRESPAGEVRERPNRSHC